MTAPMTTDEVIDLLSAMIAYDNRNPGESNVAAWRRAAEIGRWTLDEALDALDHHYVSSTEFVMPGHLTPLIRQARRDAHERSVTEMYRQPAPASLPAGVDIPGRHMDPELAEVHAEFNARPCDQCKAPARQRCADSAGRPTKIPHFSRLSRKGAA